MNYLQYLSKAYPIFFCLYAANVWATKQYNNFRLDSAKGRLLLESLQDANIQTNTTSFRKETKAFIDKTLFQTLFSEWIQPNTDKVNRKNKRLSFVSRDQNKRGKLNGTFTFYGRGVSFWNLGVKTTLKLRARFYMDYDKDNRIYSRSPDMPDFVYLEVKMKNDDPHFPGSGQKLRLKIADADLVKLFQNKLSGLEKGLLKLNPNKKKLVTKMSQLIHKLNGMVSGFCTPLFAIRYQRHALKFEDKNYHLRKMFAKKMGKIEYHLTYDQDIKGFLVQNWNPLQTFQDYLESACKQDLVYDFPLDIVCVEIKVPRVISAFKTKYLPGSHQAIRKAINVLQNPSEVSPSFQLGKGKLGNLKLKLKAMPEYDFLWSGKG